MIVKLNNKKLCELNPWCNDIKLVLIAIQIHKCASIKNSEYWISVIFILYIILSLYYIIRIGICDMHKLKRIVRKENCKQMSNNLSSSQCTVVTINDVFIEY